MCARVHACGHLLELPNSSISIEERHGELGRLFRSPPTRYYYISVNDLEYFENEERKEEFFIACTADRILLEKPDCCDLFIHHQTLNVSKAHAKSLQHALHSTESDKRKAKELEKLCEEKKGVVLEMAIHDYFSNLNEQVLNLFKRHTCKKMSIDDYTRGGLFDSNDAYFLEQLSTVLEADATIEIPLIYKSPCCTVL